MLCCVLCPLPAPVPTACLALEDLVLAALAYAFCAGTAKERQTSFLTAWRGHVTLHRFWSSRTRETMKKPRCAAVFEPAVTCTRALTLG